MRRICLSAVVDGRGPRRYPIWGIRGACNSVNIVRKPCCLVSRYWKRQTRREAVTQSHGSLEGGETAGLPKGAHLGDTYPITPHCRGEPGRSKLLGSGELGRVEETPGTKPLASLCKTCSRLVCKPGNSR